MECEIDMTPHRNQVHINPTKLVPKLLIPWASCQIRKIAGCACAGNAGKVSPPQRVSDPELHHSTCVVHVPWCMSGSLTSGFLWSQWRGKLSRHSRRMRNLQFCVSGDRPMDPLITNHIARDDADRNIESTVHEELIDVQKCNYVIERWNSFKGRKWFDANLFFIVTTCTFLISCCLDSQYVSYSWSTYHFIIVNCLKKKHNTAYKWIAILTTEMIFVSRFHISKTKITKRWKIYKMWRVQRRVLINSMFNKTRRFFMNI